jgi:hypothetical protein
MSFQKYASGELTFRCRTWGKNAQISWFFVKIFLVLEKNERAQRTDPR